MAAAHSGSIISHTRSFLWGTFDGFRNLIVPQFEGAHTLLGKIVVERNEKVRFTIQGSVYIPSQRVSFSSIEMPGVSYSKLRIHRLCPLGGSMSYGHWIYRSSSSFPDICNPYMRCLVQRSTFTLEATVTVFATKAAKEVVLDSALSSDAISLKNQVESPRTKKRPPNGLSSTSAVWHICRILAQNPWGSATVESLTKLNLKLRPHHVSQVLGTLKDINLALDFFHWSKGQSCYSPDALNYNMMIGMVAKSHTFNSIVPLLEEMRVQGWHLNASTFMTIIVQYDAVDKVLDALSLFDSIQEYGLQPNISIYTCLIDLLAKRGYHDSAKIMYGKMEESQCSLDVTAFNILMRAFGRAQNIALVCKLFHQMLEKGFSPESGTYGFLIAALGKSGQVDDALKYFDEMTERGLTPNLPTCNILIDSLGKSGKLDKAQKLFSEMLQKGPQPDVVSHNSLLDCLGKSGRVDEAYKLYKEMVDKGICPNSHTGSILVDSLSKAGRLEKACDLFLEIEKSEGVSFDVVIYNILLNRLGKEGCIDQVIRLFQEMKDVGQKPDLISYNTVIESLCKWQHFEEANQLLNEMKAAGCSPDVATYNSLIHSYGNQGKVARAKKLFHEMVRKGLHPDIISHNILISTLIKARKIEEAMKIYEGMANKGVAPDVVTYNSLIDGFGQTKDYSTSFRFFQEMQLKGISPDKVTYTVLINGLAKKRRADDAWKLYREMKKKGYTPDVITFNSLINCFVVEGRISEANEILIRMKGMGCKPTATTYGMLIDANARRANDDMVQKLRRERNEAGFIPEWGKEVQ